MPRTSAPVPTARAGLGARAETLAADYLARQGLVVVARNFRTRRGEIDVIVRDRDTLVFVEVRKRSKDSYGGALASVTRAKQRRLIVAAQIFLQRYRMPPACRFDVIGYDHDRMHWLKNAVEASPDAY